MNVLVIVYNVRPDTSETSSLYWCEFPFQRFLANTLQLINYQLFNSYFNFLQPIFNVHQMARC